MPTKIISRILLDLILFYALSRGWWFIIVFLGTLGAWHFPLFIEILIAGVAFDALFGLQVGAGIWSYVGTLSALVIYVVVTIFKRLVRK